MAGIVYTDFLRAPSAAALAADATLTYVTTTIAISEPAAILKHIAAQAKQVVKKDEKVLNVIEGPVSTLVETETTIQFNNGGGAFLPGMDENLLDEKTIALPLMHVVAFDAMQKIKEIRLHWDQGTLLKEVEAIGRTGRNWPIRDAKAQVDAVTNSVKNAGASAKPRDPQDAVLSQHARRDTSTSTTGNVDPSPAPFSHVDPNENAGPFHDRPIHAKRASVKPAPRDLTEILTGGDTGKARADSHTRSPSPSKGPVFKSGAGKHFKGNRLFGQEEDEDSTAGSPDRSSNGRSYDGPSHATRTSAKPAPRDLSEILSGEEPAHRRADSQVRSPSPNKGLVFKGGAGKHFKGNRLFEDDAEADTRSPERAVKKTFNQKYNHFDFGNGEDAPAPGEARLGRGNSNPQPGFSFEEMDTPIKHTAKHRRDDARRWDANDEDVDEQRSTHSSTTTQPSRPVTSSTTTHPADPASPPTSTPNNPNPPKAFHRQQAQSLYHNPLSGDDALFSRTNAGLSDENLAPTHKSGWERGIKTAGNGMGGPKGSGRGWAIGDEGGSDGEREFASVGHVADGGLGGRGRSQAAGGAE